MYSVEDKKKEILRGYQFKRDEALREAEDRKKKLYSKYPVLKEIEDQINKIGLETTKQMLRGEVSKEEAHKVFEEKFEKLTKDRERCYTENKIPLDYIEPKYECNDCQDTGMLDTGKKCRCFEQQLLEDVYMLSNMKVLLETQNFDNLEMDVYSTKVIGGKVQRDIMIENIKNAKKFINNISDGKEKSLLFYGPTGSGKTFLSSCVAKEVLDSGNTVIYTTISELVDLARLHVFGDIDKEVNERYDMLLTCDLLIIDDLGTELINKFVVSELYKIINSRLINSKKVIISTNLELKEIYSQYTGRIFDRMIEGYKMLEFVGPNIRKKKLD